jgi:thioredoxin reductase
MFDVCIIGGGASGLSAALYLARMRRQAVVFDAGKPANRFTKASHSFFTRDGTAPAELLQIGREQLKPYETVKVQMQEVVKIVRQNAHFELITQDGESYQSRKVLLTMGLKDNLPEIEGVEKFWGRGIFPCPFCDGWEHRDKKLVAFSNDEGAIHLAKLLRQLSSDVTICTGAESQLGAENHSLLEKYGVKIIETPLLRFAGNEHLEEIVFADGTSIASDAVFLRSFPVAQSPFAIDLSCELDENQMIKIDPAGRTSVSGVYAAGDLVNRMRQVHLAVTSGAMAASGMIHDLLAEDFV